MRGEWSEQESKRKGKTGERRPFSLGTRAQAPGVGKVEGPGVGWRVCPKPVCFLFGGLRRLLVWSVYGRKGESEDFQKPITKAPRKRRKAMATWELGKTQGKQKAECDSGPKK